jgi:hypothetical protein
MTHPYADNIAISNVQQHFAALRFNTLADAAPNIILSQFSKNDLSL